MLIEKKSESAMAVKYSPKEVQFKTDLQVDLGNPYWKKPTQN